jgi:peptide/nickel transport system permease protein
VRRLLERFRRLTGDPLTAAAAVTLALFVGVAVAGPMLSPHAPFETLRDGNGTPLRLQAPAPGHWLGTTTRGQDVLSQVVHGARIALIVGVVSALLAALVGASIGLLSGYFGRLVDQVLMRLTDVAFGIPTLPFALIVVTILGPGVLNTVLVISAILWRTQARVIRSQVLTIKERAYIRAARIAGAGHARIVLLHIAPNVLPFLLLYLAVSVAQSVLLEAGLSFLGFGDPRVVSWGRMLNDAFEAGAVRTAWWWVLPPGLALSTVVVSSFLLVRRFEEAVNPRLRAM